MKIDDTTKYMLAIGSILYIGSLPFMIIFYDDYWLRMPFYLTFGFGLLMLLSTVPIDGERGTKRL